VDLWDRLPAWLGPPSWLRNQAGLAHGEAEIGFRILGAEARQAVPALIKLYEQDISLVSQDTTSNALISIGPAGQRLAIPSFLRGAASSNVPVRVNAVLALFQLDAEQLQVVPALVKALSDTIGFIRADAAGVSGALEQMRNRPFQH